jgi:tetratricopeptide (TPR) repeat protein
MGLFHSTYSNSWVGLALFKPNAERHKLRALVDEETEELVHIMCSVPRMSLTFTDILGMEKTGIPKEGITVKDIHTGGDLHLSQRMIAIYTVFHIADWLEQFYGWQDKLFRVDEQTGDEEGDMAVPFLKMLKNEFKDNAGTLWPGENKPGLYLSVLSKLGQILATSNQPDLIPPIFDNCTKFLSAKAEKEARDLYWTVTQTLTEAKDGAEAQKLLTKTISLNPFIAEPHILLGQIYMREGRIEEGIAEARQALKLLYAMGVNWDKRVSWEAWINWCRVMIRLGLKKEWPTTSMGIINVGLVEDK